MGIAIILVFFILVVLLDKKKKSTVVPILLVATLGPKINIGSSSIDATYLFVILLFGYIFTSKRKISLGTVKRYNQTMILCFFVFSISWMLFSRQDVGSLLSYGTGILKNIILLYECWNLNKRHSENIETDIFKFVASVILINAVFVAFQKLFFSASIDILRQAFLSPAEFEVLMAETYAGRFNRFGGLFSYSMHLGVFCAIAFSFLITFENEKINKLHKYLITVCCVVVGIISSTKSFFLGMAVACIFYIAQNLLHRKNKKIRLFCTKCG